MTLKEFENHLHNLVQNFRGGAVGFVENLAHSIEMNGGQVLRDAAKAEVDAAEAAGGLGDDKQKAVLASVIAVLEAEGIPVVIAAVKGAIEAAVANLRAV